VTETVAEQVTKVSARIRRRVRASITSREPMIVTFSEARVVPKQHDVVLVVTSVPPPAAGRHGEPVATCLGHRALFVHEQVLRIERDPRLE
jgi:hypothetical protein